MTKDNFNFSLESVTSSIYGNSSKNKSSEAAKVFVKNGLMPIFFESCESSEPYSMAAQEHFNEGKQFSMFADLALESLSSNVRFVRNMKMKAKSMGIESASFSLEEGGVNVKEVVKKVIFAIKVAIKKFITAIANFIKSISNWIGSQFVGLQDKVYQDALKANYKQLLAGEGGKLTINAVPVMNVQKIFDAQSVLPNIEKILNSVETLPENPNDSGFIKDFVNAIKVSFEKIFTGNPHVAEAQKLMNGISEGKLPSGSTYAKVFVYGTTEPKAIEVAIKDFCNADDYKILTKEHAMVFAKSVSLAKKASAAMSKTLKNTDKVMSSITANEGENSKLKMKKLMFEKNIHGFNVGFLLTYYSLYLKQRSIMTRALKMVMASGNKTTAVTEKK